MAQPETNYTWEMLASVPSQIAAGVWAMLALLATFFLGPWAIPIFFVIYAGVAGVAALSLPDMQLFRAWIDKTKRREQREAVRERLQAMLDGCRNGLPEGHWGQNAWVHNAAFQQFNHHQADYKRMMERLASLKSLANDPRNPISDQDIERLEDATIDFLRLFHTHLTLQRRVAAVEGEDRIRNQLASMEHQLRDESFAGAERKRLEKSKAELLKLQEQRKRLPGQVVATEAQLTTMAEVFEEVYHRITANPQAASSAYLEEASSRLAADEEIALSVEEEMGELSDLTKYRAARAAATKVHQ